MSESRVLIADVHGLAGRLAELRALLADLASASVAEAGCESFRVLEAEEPGDLLLLEVFKDDAALRAHYRTSHYRRYRAQVGELLARPSDVVVLDVRETIHARDPNPPDPGMLG